MLLGVAGFGLGWGLAGPMGALVLAGGAAAVPPSLVRRRTRRQAEALERQVTELTEAMALGLRAGLSIPQAMRQAAAEAEAPMTGLLATFLREQELGQRFEDALDRFAVSVGTEDFRLLALVIGIHGRTGGDVAGALEEVLRTMRRRTDLRRELRGLTAQGRLSGVILGAVPLGFFLFLAVTSQEELGPVYWSAPGMAMVGAGLALEALAFLWIRRLLRIEM